MTHEKLTAALYDWCLASARVQNLPMGMRPVPWRDLTMRDPDAAERWREAVDFLLARLGWDEPRGTELVFDGSPVGPGAARMAAEADPGNEHRITPDDG